MLLSSLLLLHVCCATVGMLAGLLTIAFRKGSGLHGAAGTVFTVSMLIAAAAGATVAIFLRPNNGNVMGSLLTFYLVATAWVAAKRTAGKPGAFDVAALLFAMAIVATGAMSAIAAANSNGSKHGYPTGFFIFFGSIALLFALSDVRMLLRGGVFGAKRIARHLFRNCLALLFAAMSFYPGQKRFIPVWLQETNLLFLPHVLVAGALIFWMYRVRVRRRVQHDKLIPAV